MRTVNGLASFGILLVILIASAEETKAQGILQRLQQRVQARRFAPPQQSPTQPQAAQPRYQNPAAQNRGKGANVPTTQAPTSPVTAEPVLASPVAAAQSTGTVSTGTVSTGTVSTGTVSTGTVSTGTVGSGTVSSGTVGTLGPANLANTKPAKPAAPAKTAAPVAANTAVKGQTTPLQSDSKSIAATPSPSMSSDAPSAPSRNPLPSAANAASILAAGKSILENGSGDKQSDSSSNNGQPTLGVDVSERTERDGLVVVGFKPESKATLVGLREGDLILSMNGRPVTVIGEAVEVLSSTAIGRNVRLEVERSGSNLVVHVPVVARSSRPDAPSQSLLPPQQVAQESPSPSGMAFEDLGITGDTVKGVRGIKIDSVVPGSPAALAGFEPGDRLVSIDGRLLINVNTLDREMNRFEPGKSVAAQVVRDGQLMQARMELNPKSQWPAPSKLVTSPAETKKSGSAFNGLGSMIGGLFSAESTSKDSESTSPNEDATKQASSEFDPMELNDEPITKAGFVEPIEIEAPAIIDEMDFNDEFEAPKALEKLTPPAAEKEDPIQSEIESLEKRLNELKAKAAKKD